LKPNIRRSSEIKLEKDSIINMETPLTQYSSAQQLSTSDEILTGAVEEKVTVIITVQPSSNSAQLNDNESRPKKTKSTCDNSKKVGHTASKHFTKPNASKKAEKTYEGTLKKHWTLKPSGQELAINANVTVLIIHSEIAAATDAQLTEVLHLLQ
jgi:hypothetical protein